MRDNRFARMIERSYVQTWRFLMKDHEEAEAGDRRCSLRSARSIAIAALPRPV